MKFFFVLIIFLPLINKAQKNIYTKLQEAELCYLNGQYENAFEQYSALNSIETTDSIKVETLLRLGNLFAKKNISDSSLIFFNEAVTIASKKKLPQISRIFYHIGSTYFSKTNFGEALKYYNKSFEYANSSKDSLNAYIGLLIINLKQKNFSRVFENLKILKKLPPNISYYQNYYINQATGLYYFNLRKCDSAIFFLKKASTIQNDFLRANVFNDLAEVYLYIKDYKTAFAYQDSISGINFRMKESENILPMYDVYKKIYAETGDYKKAYLYADSARYLSDSIFNVEKNNSILDAEAKYQNEKSKAEKTILEKDNSIKKRSLIFSFAGLVLLSLLAMVALRNNRLRKKANTILSTQKLAVEKLAEELTIANNTKARLFSTISHDLRSPLSSLYAQVKLQELQTKSSNSDISKNTTKLLDTLEELLVWSKSQMDGFVLQNVNINMYEIFEELKDFYSASSANKNIILENKIRESIIIKTDENILKTILRNIINNAINYSDSNTSVHFNAEKNETNTHITIANHCTLQSFLNMQNALENTNIKSNSSGLGIILVKEFVEKINAKISIAYKGEMVFTSIIF